MPAKKTVRFSASVSLFVLLFFTGLSADALGSLQINVTDPNPTYWAFSKPPFPCPRGKAAGDPLDDCYVHAFVSTDATGKSDATFASAWDAWNDAQPAGQKWTLKDGGPLSGTLNITTFDAYDDCDGFGGVTVEAHFTPAGSDPTEWKWAQGLYALPTARFPHNTAPPPAPFSQMDVLTGKDEEPPLYPYVNNPGNFFYDKPEEECYHNHTTKFLATAMIVEINRDVHLLTAYEGFSYGFDYPCVHTPEPAAMVVWSVLIITICIGACVQKSKTAGRASGLWEKVGFVFTREPQ